MTTHCCSHSSVTYPYSTILPTFTVLTYILFYCLPQNGPRVLVDDGDGGLRGTEFSRRLAEMCGPGTACSVVDSNRNLKTQTTRRLEGGLSVVAQENGPVILSVNGKGHSGSSSIGVLKPSSTAVVRSAFLFVTTHYGVVPGVKLNGVSIPWDGTAANSDSSLDLHSFYADVTTVVKPTVDGKSAGELFLPVVETSHATVNDGEVLAVIFEDPALVSDNSISLLFGALNSAGDSFQVTFYSPIAATDLSDPSIIMDLSLGIGFGSQAHMNQFSHVVSGQTPIVTRKKHDHLSAYFFLIITGC
jgi:hypothetical protein